MVDLGREGLQVHLELLDDPGDGRALLGGHVSVQVDVGPVVDQLRLGHACLRVKTGNK